MFDKPTQAVSYFLNNLLTNYVLYDSITKCAAQRGLSAAFLMQTP